MLHASFSSGARLARVRIKLNGREPKLCACVILNVFSLLSLVRVVRNKPPNLDLTMLNEEAQGYVRCVSLINLFFLILFMGLDSLTLKEVMVYMLTTALIRKGSLFPME